MPDQFGIYRARYGRRLLESCDLPPHLRLYVWMVCRIYQQSNLKAAAAESVRAWCKSVYPEADAGKVGVVCMTNRQAADDLFNGATVTVRRAVRKLCDLGLIERVREGRKGSPSIYAFLPLSDGGQNHSDDVPAFQTDEGTAAPGSGNNDPPMGEQSDAVTCGDISPSLPFYIPLPQPTTKEAQLCPTCHQPLIRQPSGRGMCGKCLQDYPLS